MASQPAPLDPIVNLLLRWLIGGLFVFAGLAKLIDPPAFVEQLNNYRLVPDTWLIPLVWFLPSLETILGVCLLVNRWSRETLVLILGLLGVFLVALITARVRGLNLECGCFGTLEHGGSYVLWIGRDLLLAAVTAYLLRIDSDF